MCDDVRELVSARDFVAGLVVDMVGIERERECVASMVRDSDSDKL